MKRLLCVGMLCAGSMCLTNLARATNYIYGVGGSFSSSAMAPNSLNQLYDDGLHGDGAAGDNIFGVDIAVDEPAGHYQWAVAGPSLQYSSGFPYCWCNIRGIGQALLYTTGPGDVIHFTFDMRSRGFAPSPGIACDHGKPVGNSSSMQVDIDSIYPSAGTSYPATLVGAFWDCVVTVPSAGSHAYAFSTVDGTVSFGPSYNGSCGCDPVEEPLNRFITLVPNTDVRFQFDEASGQMRAIVLGVTPTRSSSWGSLKSHYR